MKTILYLEDGSYYYGENFGIEGEIGGELTFITSMTGYQEELTNPENKNKIIIMAYPEIGSYGVNSEDVLSDKVHANAIVVRKYNALYSNHRAEKSLGDYLIDNNTYGVTGIDTRAIISKIRDKKNVKGIISNVDFNLDSLNSKLRKK
ncbi:MAG: hypothetical protein GX287_04705 [Fusobacteria bacterium]|nr:hypothetical protein [Fusobacteriota bacterium]